MEPPGAPPAAETVGEGVGDDILERSQATWFQDQNANNIRREAAKFLDMRRLEGDLLVNVQVRRDRPQVSRRLTRRDSNEESAAMMKKGRPVVRRITSTTECWTRTEE